MRTVTRAATYGAILFFLASKYKSMIAENSFDVDGAARSPKRGRSLAAVWRQAVFADARVFAWV